MALVDYMSKERVLLGMKATNKTEALDELSWLLSFGNPSLDRTKICRALREREELGSTGIGSEVAVPHARYDPLSSHRIALAVHPAGSGLPIFRSISG